jgi:hypothetical protein
MDRKKTDETLGCSYMTSPVRFLLVATVKDVVHPLNHESKGGFEVQQATAREVLTTQSKLFMVSTRSLIVCCVVVVVVIDCGRGSIVKAIPSPSTNSEHERGRHTVPFSSN